MDFLLKPPDDIVLWNLIIMGIGNLIVLNWSISMYTMMLIEGKKFDASLSIFISIAFMINISPHHYEFIEIFLISGIGTYLIQYVIISNNKYSNIKKRIYCTLCIVGAVLILYNFK